MLKIAHRGRGVAAAVRRPGFARSVAQTGMVNLSMTVLAAGSGLVVARALGAELRGEYAAVTAWFGMALVFGGLGQTAAICFFVAHDQPRAKDYVATSRSIMLVSGVAVALVGLLVAPTLAHHRPALSVGFRVMFATCIIAFAGASYAFALQARDVSRWNLIRATQPALFVLAILVLALIGALTLLSVLLALAGSIIVQTGLAYLTCVQLSLAPGRADRSLVRDLLRYGSGQLTGSAPSALNTRLDQLAMSLTIPAADLGRYAVAVSLTSLALPAVAALGYVAFPHLAAQHGRNAAAVRIEKVSLAASAVVATAILLPLALGANWLIPNVFGPSFTAAAPLVWLLAPGGFFLATGQVMGDLLRGRNAPWRVAHAQLAGAVVTVVALGVLLPLIGAAGAAIASTCSYAVSWGWLAWALRRPG